MDIKDLKIEDYNYTLPTEKIAKFPLDKRDSSKLLRFNENKISEFKFSDIHDLLPVNSLLIFNNTKVIHARLQFFKSTGARIEIFCLEPHAPSDYEINFSSKGSCIWKCMVGNLKKWKNEILMLEYSVGEEKYLLKANKISVKDAEVLVKFSWSENIPFSEIIEKTGTIPIPPYLNRKPEKLDNERYQTIYSKYKGSVAAPTAGLHFTKEVLKNFGAKNIELAELTLHVGAGTFKPVNSEKLQDHEMHTEHFSIQKETLEKLLKFKNKIVAVGTTSVRTLESLFYLGIKVIDHPNIHPSKLFVSQWDPYEINTNVSSNAALSALLGYMEKNNLESLHSLTQIIIVPGYKFKLVNHLITNFHMPKSTLLLLIAAFVGSYWKDIYNYALENNFRFLSYGDSSFLSCLC